MKVSQLLKRLQEYMDFYGDQPVKVYDRDSNDTLIIHSLDVYKNEFCIEIRNLDNYDEEDDEEDDDVS